MTDRFQKVFVDSETALWNWLEANHQSAASYLLVTWKKTDPTRYLSRDQILDGLLAYGWVDGRRYTLDDTKTMQLICKRQQQKWTESYRKRIEKLQANGRMKQAGLEMISIAQANGTWLADQDVDNLEIPSDLYTALHQKKGLDWWEASAPSYRRNILRWLKSAKKAETRQKRCDIISDSSLAGQKIPNF